MELKARWYTSLERIELIERSWRSLFNRVPNPNPFMSWEWVSAWIKVFHPRADILCLIVSDDSQRPIMILGFSAVNTLLDKCLGVSRWRLFGAGDLACADHLGVLVYPNLSKADQEQITQIVKNRLSSSTSVLELPALCERDRCVAAFISHCEDALVNTRRTTGPACPVVELPDSWDGYLASLSSNFRSQVKKSFRLAQSELELVRIFDADQVAEAIQSLIIMSGKRHQLRGSQSTLTTAAMTAFLGEIVPSMLDQEIVWVDALKAHGRFVAVSINFIDQRTVYYYQGSFDESFAKYRPSTVLFAVVIQRAIARGLKRYDFLRGNEPYKARWGATDEYDTSLAIVSPKTRAVLAQWLAGMKPRLRQWLGRCRMINPARMST